MSSTQNESTSKAVQVSLNNPLNHNPNHHLNNNPLNNIAAQPSAKQTKQFVNLSLPSILMTLGVVGITPSAFASGFALVEQSVPNLGNAASGGAAGIDDASTIFFNPAGLTRLEGDSFVGAGYLILPTTKFRNQGSTVGGAPALGGNGGDAGPTSFVPNLYGAWSLSDRVKVGIGVNAPFGLATEYDSDWVGRYQAIESELITININPTVAAKLTDNFSVGVGLDVQYARAELSNAIDFGSFIGLSQQADGLSEVEGDDWSVGYNVGVLYEPTETTRIGLAYRSAITHTLQGAADFAVPTAAAPLTATGQFTDTDASAELKLPDSLSFGVYQELSPQWSIVGDVTWTNWSRFEELRIEFDNPAQEDVVQPENWEDTVRIGFGINYKPDEIWTLRAGAAYDPSPVDDQFVTAEIPDSDRFWVTVGAGYRPSDNISLDVAYAHLFFNDRAISQSDPVAGDLIGTYESQADIVGVQFNWRF
ncbi:MAG: OmpP1/FadL family transporter [Pseudanabaenales cyanobacterium]|nr:OmpP1/FadL family transporter [Pseudanabaenales cyanobacterium]